MKTKKRFAVRAFLAVFCAAIICLSFGLAACGGEEPPSETTDPTLESITLNTDNVKKVFDFGDEFTYEGLVVTAHMSDGSTQAVDLSQCRVTTPDLTTPGTRSVNVVYSGKSARYEITVNERVMPPISDKSMFDIPEGAATVYRVEAEDIDLNVSGVKSAGGELVLTDDNAGVTYVGNYGVFGNYFGFTFTSAKEYTDVTIVFHMSSPTEESLAPGNAFGVYLNYENYANPGSIDIAGMTALPGMTAPETEEGGDATETADESGENPDGEEPSEPAPAELVWEERVVRGVTIAEGTNTLTFDVKDDFVPNIDYIEFYVGTMYINSRVEVTEKTLYVKEFEDFDLDKIQVRQDIKDHYGLGDGEAFIETPSTNAENTSGGKSVGAFVPPTEISTVISNAEKATVRISFMVASVDNVKIKDNFEFYIDGNLMTEVQDISIQGGDAGSMRYWEWVETVIGYVDLEPGSHLFTVKMIAQTGAINADCFRFDVLSYGEFTEHEDPIEFQSATVGSAGVKCSFEAEDMEYSKGASVQTPAGNAYQTTSGFQSVNVTASAGNTFGFDINSGAAGKAKLRIRAAWGGDEIAFDDVFSVTNGSAAVTTGAKLVKDEGADTYLVTPADEDAGTAEVWEKKYTHGDAFNWNWKVIETDIDLVAGVNEIRFEVREGATAAVNFDKFEVIVTQYGEDTYEIPAVMKEDCSAVITAESVTTRAEAEDADYGSVSLCYDNLKANQPMTESATGAAATVTSGLVVGKLGLKGNKIVFNVWSDVAVNDAGIRFSMSVGDDLKGDTWKVNDLCAFRFNDEQIKASDDAVFTGYDDVYQYWNWEPFVIGGVDIKAGVNTLEIEILGDKAPNIDYVEFITGEEVTEADVTVNADGKYTVEAEEMDLSGFVLQAGWDHINIETPGTDDTSGGKSLGAIGDGSKVKITVKTEQKATIQIVARIAKAADNDASNEVSSYISGVKFGDSDITVGGTFELGTSDTSQFYHWQDVVLGEVTVDAGTYEFTCTLNGSPNVDCFNFVVSSYGA